MKDSGRRGKIFRITCSTFQTYLQMLIRLEGQMVHISCPLALTFWVFLIFKGLVGRNTVLLVPGASVTLATAVHLKDVPAAPVSAEPAVCGRGLICVLAHL